MRDQFRCMLRIGKSRAEAALSCFSHIFCFQFPMIEKNRGIFKSARNRCSLTFPLFFYSSRAREKAGRIYSCALRLNPHSAARRFQFSRTVFRTSAAIAVASLVLISQYGAISSARSREIVASSSFTQRDSSSPSGTGFTSYRGERCQPSALRLSLIHI